MSKIRTLRKRRAVSPVIATVIIVAVTITVAVAVSYWISGISSQYTQFEKVEIQSALFTPGTLVATPPHWEITITLKNSGTKTATITNVFVNNVIAPKGAKPIGADGQDPGLYSDVDPDFPESMESGATGEVIVWIEAGDPYCLLSSGTTVNIKLHSAGGMDYIRLVQLT